MFAHLVDMIISTRLECSNVPNQQFMMFSFGSDAAYVGGRQRGSSLDFRIALKRRR